MQPLKFEYQLFFGHSKIDFWDKEISGLLNALRIVELYNENQPLNQIEDKQR